MSTDRILKEIGECGRYQLFVSVLVSIFTFIPAIHTVMPVYTAAMRNFWCTDWVNKSVSGAVYSVQNVTSNVHNLCSVTLILGNRSSTFNSSHCSVWEYDQSQFQSTIISQYRLTCDRENLLHLGTLIYMLSYLSGCTLWGYISDRIGRTLTLLVAALVTGPASTLTCFINNYWIYLILRAITAFGCSAYLPTGATYISEIVTPKYQTLFVVNVFGNGFPLGCCFLVLVVYIIRNHIHIQAVASALSFMPLLFFPIIQESPRWLLANSKYCKAYKVCRYISVFNSSIPLSRDIFEKLCQQHTQLKDSSQNDEEKEDDEPVLKRALTDLVTKRKVFCLLLLMGYNFFASSFLYFALILGTAELGGDIFITLLLMSLLEIVSHAVSSLIGAKFGNLGIVLVSFTLSGVNVILSGLLQHYNVSSLAVVTCSVIGRFFISAAFTMQFNLVSGLFPTWARNFTLGFCLALSRIGSLIGALIFLTKNIWHPLPFLILGFSALTAAIFNLIYLPEIHRKPLPESMDQTEKLAEFRRFQFVKCCKSSENIEVFEEERN